MTNILVTGANGFVGYPLIKKLVNNGYCVRASFCNNKPEFLGKNAAIADWWKFDLNTDDNDYQNLLDDIDVVIHLAAKVHDMKKNQQELEIYRKINVLGTKRLADESVASGVKRFIYISTVKVHGEKTSDSSYFGETDPLHPSGPYAISKLEAEQAIATISKTSSMDFVIFRPPLIYGPCVKGNFLRLVNAVANGIPLPLASIRNSRSILCVENLTDVITKCIKQPNVTNKIYLIKDIDISLPDLIKNIAQQLDKRALLFPFPRTILQLAGQLTGKRNLIDRLNESLLIDNSKLLQEFNWSPRIGFQEGLKTTIDWVSKLS